MIKELTVTDVQNISGGVIDRFNVRALFEEISRSIPESDGAPRSSSTFTGSSSRTTISNRVVSENGDSMRTFSRETMSRPLTLDDLRSSFGF